MEKIKFYRRVYYLFLWITGLILIITLTNVRYLNNKFVHPMHSYKAENEDVANIINALLLNISDLQFSEKKEFINLLLLNGGDENVTIASLDKRRTIYRKILEKRINTVKKSGRSDFYIKPVPN
jgi:hypothetical protein